MAHGITLGLADVGSEPGSFLPSPGSGGGFQTLTAMPGKSLRLTGLGNVITGGSGNLSVTGGAGLATVVAGSGNDTVQLGGGLNTVGTW